MGKDRQYIFFISVLVLSILLAIEFIIIPLRFNLTRDIALMGFASKPGSVIDEVHINRMGFTGDVISMKKDPGKIRVLTLGGSSMFNRHMTERIKRDLNIVSDRPVEVLGAALQSHTSKSSLLKYRALSKYQFDYVLLCHAANDIFVNNVDSISFRSDYSHMSPWYKRNFLLDNSLIARIIYNKLIWGRSIFGMEKVWYIYPKKEIENAMNFVSERLFEDNINIIVKEIKKSGAVPVLMTFAWSIPDNYSNEAFNKKLVGYNNPTDYDQHPVELFGAPEYVREGLRRHNAVLRDISAKQDCLLIDQENLIGKELHWFGDPFHLSEEGTEKFVGNITEFFLEKILFK